jgi:hypothetical protein
MLERCAALDVHQKTVVACARILKPGGELEEVIVEFSTMAADLLALRDWLRELEITHVAMEATGVYWKPIYYVLEDDFELLLVNAAHVKNVPGRKTDTLDAQWLCQLLECGLLRASFVPPKPIRELRDLSRYRKSLIKERQQEANRLTRCSRTPASSSRSSPPTCSASPADRCSTRCCRAPAIPRSSPNWPAAGFGRNCPPCAKHWSATSSPTTR